MKLRYMTAALVIGLTLVGCDRVDQQPEPAPAPVEQADCDWGDLHEKTPDPDCKGLWLGTPTPAGKPSAKPVPTLAKPKTVTTRRR